MITSSAARKGAPSVKNTIATESSETIRYSSACTAFRHVMTITVARMATTAAT